MIGQVGSEFDIIVEDIKCSLYSVDMFMFSIILEFSVGAANLVLELNKCSTSSHYQQHLCEVFSTKALSHCKPT